MEELKPGDLVVFCSPPLDTIGVYDMWLGLEGVVETVEGYDRVRLRVTRPPNNPNYITKNYGVGFIFEAFDNEFLELKEKGNRMGAGGIEILLE